MTTTGRPLTQLEDLPEGWAEDMVKLSTDGASAVMLRGEVFSGMSRDLWYRLIADEPEFSDTVKRCKELCQIWWEKRGMEMASGDADGNASVWIFNMKNRFDWRDKKEIGVSGELGVPRMSREEFKQRMITMLQDDSG